MKNTWNVPAQVEEAEKRAVRMGENEAGAPGELRMNKKEITVGRAGSFLPIWITQAIQVCKRCQSSSSTLTLTSNAVRPLGQSCRLRASQWSVLSVCLDLMR